MSGDNFTFDDPDLGQVNLIRPSPERLAAIHNDAFKAASQKAAQVSRGQMERRELRKAAYTVLLAHGVLQAAVVDDDLRHRLGLDDPTRLSQAAAKRDSGLLLRLSDAVVEEFYS